MGAAGGAGGTSGPGRDGRGAIDVNGRGTFLTTEECLLGEVQARNPGLGPRGASNVSSPITWASAT